MPSLSGVSGDLACDSPILKENRRFANIKTGMRLRADGFSLPAAGDARRRARAEFESKSGDVPLEKRRCGESVPADFMIEGRARNIQDPGCQGDVELGDFEEIADIVLFQFSQSGEFAFPARKSALLEPQVAVETAVHGLI